MELALDTVWSLQYMVPGVVCAAAGAVVSTRAYAAAADAAAQAAASAAAAAPLPQFTHVVHFRLAGRPALEALLACPQHTAAMASVVEPCCSATAQVVFEGSVRRCLEELYWRGEQYSSGVEHLLFLSPGAAGLDGADAFLAALAGLAESSVAGGLQSSAGVVLSSCGQLSCSHVLMTRFASQGQVALFMETKPCEALQEGDPRLPLVAYAGVCWSVAPADETSVAGGGLPVGG